MKTALKAAGWSFAALAVAAAAITAFAYPSYRDDVRAARARIAGSKIAQTRCGPIEYTEAGKGPALLLVHGAGGGFDQSMMAFGEALAGQGFRVVAMSRFGYLRTPLPSDASPAAQADAHACLLDELRIGRAAIFGASAGAPSSMQFALRHPERTAGLFLLVPMTYTPGTPSLAPPAAARFVLEYGLKSDFLFWLLMKSVPNVLVRTILATPVSALQAASDAEQRRIRVMLEQPLPISERQAGLLNDGAVLQALARYELEGIAAPTVVVSARDDLYGTYAMARYTAAAIPGARFVGYESGGHMWAGHHAEVLAEISTFMHTVSRDPVRKPISPAGRARRPSG